VNKAGKRRTSLLYDADAGYTDKDLDILWLEYRIGKQYDCFGEFCDHIAAFKLTEERFSAIANYKIDETRSGSGYWLTTIKRPYKWAEFEFF